MTDPTDTNAVTTTTSVHLMGSNEAGLPMVDTRLTVGGLLIVDALLDPWRQHLTLVGEPSQLIAFLRRLTEAAEAKVKEPVAS